MSNDSTTSGAGTPEVPSTPIIPSTPVMPSSPSLVDLTIADEEAIFPLTPEGLSRRQYNLFKRNRKTALRAAIKEQAADEMEDTAEGAGTNPSLPTGYKQGDFCRQARKLIKSTDKHGMLSPGTHKVVKPAVVRYYQYKRCFKVAQQFAERKSNKNGGIRML
ncbi:unnamed protein product [Aureobasidium vineae]|uniref:Uncharacterized protein n=1 Tax=Aureobasidium vineae TaxID=2773715 RepID=A0A9N8PHZ1_9PEZI|nr:unnamed protein product [Aureobasidium vineae]